MNIAVLLYLAVAVAAMSSAGEFFYSRRSSAGLSAVSKNVGAADDRALKIFQLLKSIDCRKCGFESCYDFAAAACERPEIVNLCAHSSQTIIKNAEHIWGYAPVFDNNFSARLFCTAGVFNCAEKYRYYGTKSCAGVKLLWEGNRECIYGCVGLRDCVKVCPVNAIELVDDFLPRINEDKCIGCGRCAEVCPFDVIKIMDRAHKTYIRCRTKDSGALVHKICSSGCISCMVCAKTCPYYAVDLSAKVPRINGDKCVDCGICAAKCPLGIIASKSVNEQIVYIVEQKCNMCGICAQICPSAAIVGDSKTPYRVITEKCIGCGICIARCPKSAIILKISE